MGFTLDDHIDDEQEQLNDEGPSDGNAYREYILDNALIVSKRLEAARAIVDDTFDYGDVGEDALNQSERNATILIAYQLLVDEENRDNPAPPDGCCGDECAEDETTG